MSLPLIGVLLLAIVVYWFVTQILPQRRQASLLRPTLCMGLLNSLNEARARREIELLELDDELSLVAERKAVHQILTGRDEEGWEYPEYFQPMLGQSLLLEVLLTGSLESVTARLGRQREMLDEEWMSCGIGVAGGGSDQVAVALILCREAWEPMMEEAPAPSLFERLRAVSNRA